MSVKATVGKWWRIALLVILLSVAVYALFVPGGMITSGEPAAIEADDGTEVEEGGSWHNLAFGLGLDGGARISAPPVGMMVDDIELDHGGDPSSVGNDLNGELTTILQDETDGLEAADVTVRYDTDTDTFIAEVFNDDVSPATFAAALTEAGVETDEDDVQDGVTQETRNEMITVIESKLNEAGLAGGQAFDTETLGGQHFIVSEAPGYTSGELQSLLEERGSVEVQAYVPDPDGEAGQVNITLLEQGDFDDISDARYSSQQGHHVSVSIVSDGTEEEYEETMNDIGFTTEGAQPGVNQCDIPRDADGNYDFSDTGEQWCLLTVSEGEVVSAHGLNHDLAQSMNTGEWSNDPQFIMGAGSEEEAQQLSINLRAGVLTAPLDFGNAQVDSVEPALAEQFKQYSLLIGILAILSVSGMVYVRYRDPRVAAPMVLTALAEVVILLGFAAAIRMPLDLAHVAGFIAVVGTGVDDLIIIADEVMDEGDVSQRRVFDSRFRKAFWIIGAAAATTIIAMSPLAVMSLGDLQGFAIVTILGVLIGVFITRPAYGDILRKLMTRKE